MSTKLDTCETVDELRTMAADTTEPHGRRLYAQTRLAALAALDEGRLAEHQTLNLLAIRLAIKENDK